jgi:hypothetical protein
MLKFNKKVVKLILSMGGKNVTTEQEKDYKFSLQINTKLGLLNISLHNDISEIYSIFTRFDSTDLIKDLPNVNTYSGKWNFHYTSEITILDIFKEELSKIV